MASSSSSACAAAKDLAIYTVLGGAFGAVATVLTQFRITSIAQGALLGAIIFPSVRTLQILYKGIVVPYRLGNRSLWETLHSFNWGSTKEELDGKNSLSPTAIIPTLVITTLVASKIFCFSRLLMSIWVVACLIAFGNHK